MKTKIKSVFAVTLLFALMSLVTLGVSFATLSDNARAEQGIMPASTLTAPTGLRMGGTHTPGNNQMSWNAVPGANRYAMYLLLPGSVEWTNRGQTLGTNSANFFVPQAEMNRGQVIYARIQAGIAEDTAVGAPLIETGPFSYARLVPVLSGTTWVIQAEPGTRYVPVVSGGINLLPRGVGIITGLITALPDAGNVTLADAADIEFVRQRFTAIADATQMTAGDLPAGVYDRFTDIEAALVALDNQAVADVIGLINIIPDVNLLDYTLHAAQVAAARLAYTELRADRFRDLVTNINDLIAAEAQIFWLRHFEVNITAPAGNILTFVIERECEDNPGTMIVVNDGDPVRNMTELTVTWTAATNFAGQLFNNGEIVPLRYADVITNQSAVFTLTEDSHFEMRAFDRTMMANGLRLMDEFRSMDLLVGLGELGDVVPGNFSPDDYQITSIAGTEGQTHVFLRFRVRVAALGTGAGQNANVRVFATNAAAEAWYDDPVGTGSLGETPREQHGNVIFTGAARPGGLPVASHGGFVVRNVLRYGAPTRIGTMVNNQLVLDASFQAQYDALVAELARLHFTVQPIAEQWFNTPGNRPEETTNRTNRDCEFMLSRQVVANQGIRGITSVAFSFRIFGCEDWARSSTARGRSNDLGGTSSYVHHGNISFGASTGNTGTIPAITETVSSTLLREAIQAFYAGTPVPAVPLLTAPQAAQAESIRAGMVARGFTSVALTTRSTFAHIAGTSGSNASILVFSNDAEATAFYNNPTLINGTPFATSATRIIRRYGNIVVYSNADGLLGVARALIMLRDLGIAVVPSSDIPQSTVTLPNPANIAGLNTITVTGNGPDGTNIVSGDPVYLGTQIVISWTLADYHQATLNVTGGTIATAAAVNEGVWTATVNVTTNAVTIAINIAQVWFNTTVDSEIDATFIISGEEVAHGDRVPHGSLVTITWTVDAGYYSFLSINSVSITTGITGEGTVANPFVTTHRILGDVTIVLHATDGEGADTIAVQNVIDLINALPAPASLMLTHIEAVEDAHEAYLDLRPDLRARVTNIADLLAALDRVEYLTTMFEINGGAQTGVTANVSADGAGLVVVGTESWLEARRGTILTLSWQVAATHEAELWINGVQVTSGIAYTVGTFSFELAPVQANLNIELRTFLIFQVVVSYDSGIESFLIWVDGDDLRTPALVSGTNYVRLGVSFRVLWTAHDGHAGFLHNPGGAMPLLAPQEGGIFIPWGEIVGGLALRIVSRDIADVNARNTLAEELRSIGLTATNWNMYDAFVISVTGSVLGTVIGASGTGNSIVFELFGDEADAIYWHGREGGIRVGRALIYSGNPVGRQFIADAFEHGLAVPLLQLLSQTGANDLTLTHRRYITAARLSYSRMTSAQQTAFDPVLYAFLVAAEARMGLLDMQAEVVAINTQILLLATLNEAAALSDAIDVIDKRIADWTGTPLAGVNETELEHQRSRMLAIPYVTPVIALINALPEINAITLNDRTQIEYTGDAFDALTAAQKPFVTNHAVLAAAITRLVELQQAQQQLQDLVDYWSVADISGYTAASQAVLLSALGHAQLVLGSSNITAGQIAFAKTFIDTAVEALTLPPAEVDTEDLEDLVADMLLETQDDWSDVSWTVFLMALANAQAVLAGNPTQAQVDAAYAMLNVAFDGLSEETGAQGPAGPQGPQGNPGNDGAQGPQGNPGNDGAQGPQGNPGNDGADGSGGCGSAGVAAGLMLLFVATGAVFIFKKRD